VGRQGSVAVCGVSEEVGSESERRRASRATGQRRRAEQAFPSVGPQWKKAGYGH